jgi:hypothetical protein
MQKCKQGWELDWQKHNLQRIPSSVSSQQYCIWANCAAAACKRISESWSWWWKICNLIIHIIRVPPNFIESIKLDYKLIFIEFSVTSLYGPLNQMCDLKDGVNFSQLGWWVHQKGPHTQNRHAFEKQLSHPTSWCKIVLVFLVHKHNYVPVIITGSIYYTAYHWPQCALWSILWRDTELIELRRQVESESLNWLEMQCIKVSWKTYNYWNNTASKRKQGSESSSPIVVHHTIRNHIKIP